jgi:hypothetical protein
LWIAARHGLRYRLPNERNHLGERGLEGREALPQRQCALFKHLHSLKRHDLRISAIATQARMRVEQRRLAPYLVRERRGAV